MPNNQHVHKYQRVVFNRKGNGDYIVYRCMLPDCKHYLRAEMVVGQKSICPKCGDVFIFGRADLERKKPHCLNCTRKYKRKGADEHISIADIANNLDDLLKGLT